MNRFGILASLSLSLLAGGCGSDGGGGGTVGGNDFVCSTAHKCPSGQFCYNGICAEGCNSNGDCAVDQYCDTEFDRLCHNKTVSTCPDTPCASGYSCVSGLCTPPPETPPQGCTPTFDGNDGCESNALCFPKSEDTYACYSFPYCPETGACPVGTEGAVCNDNLIPGKARICLTGACTATNNCPSGWRCWKENATDVVGTCSAGTQDSPCNTKADCAAGLHCEILGAGIPGRCAQPGAFGSPCESNDDCQTGLVCESPGSGIPNTCQMDDGF